MMNYNYVPCQWIQGDEQGQVIDSPFPAQRSSLLEGI